MSKKQVSTQVDFVKKVQGKIDVLKSAIPLVEKGSPACSLCHRRENHNRVNTSHTSVNLLLLVVNSKNTKMKKINLKAFNRN